MIWLCHNRKINWLHETCLRTRYNDKRSWFNELLEKDGSVSIDEQNLQFLATETYKISNKFSMSLTKDIFPIKRNPYNLRQTFQFSRPPIITVYHWTESISKLGPKIWDLVPSNLKDITELDKFQKVIKQRKTEECPCKLWKVFVQNVDFLENIAWKK